MSKNNQEKNDQKKLKEACVTAPRTQYKPIEIKIRQSWYQIRKMGH